MSSERFTEPTSEPPRELPTRFAAIQKDAVTKSFADALEMTASRFHQKARNKLYYNDPVLWAKEVLGFHAWSKQAEIGRSIVENSYTAVKSCHGAGKSAWAAVLVCWFITTRLMENEQVFVITTAPSYSQVHLVLWEEIRTHHANAKLPGYITQGDMWKVEKGGRTIDLAVGRKPADTDANSFQGKHADNLLIVLDEANGIPPTLYTGAVVMLTGEMKRQKMLAIGNPDDPNSEFGKLDHEDQERIKVGKKPFWNTIQIKAWHTPNFTGEEVPDKVRKVVLQKSWVEDRREQWGTEDPRWISKIEADFPDVSEDTLFSRNLLEQAKQEVVDPGWDQTMKYLGADISRYGGDRTVLVLNDGGRASVVDHWSKKSTIETGNKIHTKAIELGVTEVRVDVGAMGAGVIDFLRAHMGYNYRVIEMNGSASSPDHARWVNARAYWYDNLREQMFMNKMQLEGHKDLENELSVIRYFYTKGALQIEAKDQMKKRLNGKSPDFADALVYAMADLSGLVDDPHNQTRKPQPGEVAVLETMFARMMPGQWSVSPV